MKATSMLAEER